MITVQVINNIYDGNVIKLVRIDSSKPCLVPFIWHVLAASHMTSIKIELLDRTWKQSLVQGHTIVFGQKVCYIIEYDYSFYPKNAKNCSMLFVKYS